MELVVNFWTRGKTFSITFKNERHVQQRRLGA